MQTLVKQVKTNKHEANKQLSAKESNRKTQKFVHEYNFKGKKLMKNIKLIIIFMILGTLAIQKWLI